MNPQAMALKNKIVKNLKRLKSYISKNNIKAYRIYAKDIPEYPYLIDIYLNNAVIYEQGKNLNDEESHKRQTHQLEISEILKEILNIETNQQFFKTREKKKGSAQYNPLQTKDSSFLTIEEGNLKFLVNLEKYLDTGLFLDHRPLREYLSKNCTNQDVLNLFCYTGSLSVAAASSQARVTSVDLSSTYLEWAENNFKINNFNLSNHQFIKADILKFLDGPQVLKTRFDKIILDPPSFSNSKSMQDILDIERDHEFLIQKSMNLLKTDGELYFSTNKRKFKISDHLKELFFIKEISHWTIPLDFHHSNIHQSYLIKHK